MVASACHLGTASVQSGYFPFIFSRLSAEFLRRVSQKLRRKVTARLKKIPGFYLGCT